MNKDKKYTWHLTGNECDLIEFALHLASKVEETTGHRVIANRMEKLANEIYRIRLGPPVDNTVKIEITEHHTFAKPDDVEDIKFGDE